MHLTQEWNSDWTRERRGREQANDIKSISGWKDRSLKSGAAPSPGQKKIFQTWTYSSFSPLDDDKLWLLPLPWMLYLMIRQPTRQKSTGKNAIKSTYEAKHWYDHDMTLIILNVGTHLGKTLIRPLIGSKRTKNSSHYSMNISAARMLRSLFLAVAILVIHKSACWMNGY
jgi:hypothetical protein